MTNKIKAVISLIVFSAMTLSWTGARADSEDDMVEIQRQLNAEVMAKPFSVEEISRIDAYVADGMKKDLQPRKNPPVYWREGFTCESIGSRSYVDYRDCIYHYRYYGQYW